MVEANINVFEVLKFVGTILSIVIASIVVARAIKKGYQNYVDSKIEVMDVRITNMEKEIEDNKAENQRQHDEMKKDFIKRVDFIWNWIKDKAS